MTSGMHHLSCSVGLDVWLSCQGRDPPLGTHQLGRGHHRRADWDANAALVHMQGPVVQELVPKLLETASITRFEVYGDPGAQAAEMLVKAGAEIFGIWRGLSR